jgi:hypothetical protein
MPIAVNPLRRPGRPWDALLAIAVLVAVLAASSAAFRRGDLGTASDRVLATSDFSAFYCGALAARTHLDPYKTASLEPCQATLAYAPGGRSFADVGVDPAPLPGYDFVLLAPLTLLGYRDAGLVWLVVLIASTLATAVLLARLTRWPLGLTLALLGVTDGIISFQFGQLPPVVTLAVTAAAVLLTDGRPRAAAAVAAFSLIEPHLGLPVLAAFVLWVPPARPVVAATIVAAGLISLAELGLAANLEYAFKVLPIQAVAEAPAWFQYSLTGVLHRLGVPSGDAVRIATLQYALTAGLGILVAGPLARRLTPAVIALLPATCAVLGGPYIHLTQIGVAIPFAAYLVATAPFGAPLAALAAALLAVQWPATSLAVEGLAAVVIVGLAVVGFPNRPARARIAVGTAALALYLGVNAQLAAAKPHAGAVTPPAALAAEIARYDQSLAPTRWFVKIRTDPSRNEVSLRHDLGRLPTWLALFAVIGAALENLRRSVEVPSEGGTEAVRDDLDHRRTLPYEGDSLA